MIPLRLQVRNFMCYRDNVPPLVFEGIHLACLAGANGHGKSALLDAMTWALWGKARAKRDDVVARLDHPAVVIAADTLVFLDEQVLAKPANQVFKQVNHFLGKGIVSGGALCCQMILYHGYHPFL